MPGMTHSGCLLGQENRSMSSFMRFLIASPPFSPTTPADTIHKPTGTDLLNGRLGIGTSVLEFPSTLPRKYLLDCGTIFSLAL